MTTRSERPRMGDKAILHYRSTSLGRQCDSEDAMNTLTVSARGQVTFRKELLRHLGIEPGEKIEIDWLPGGRALRQAARPTASMASFVGLLAGRTGKPAPMCR
ncbi:AbrB/MazE/SpoVT family DNA-binding domain-containing protein [Verminephrobacter eiseniae]|uniref:AbrB/MazE/SpoVT family DNA-binding domain-containing protein n=2 Tax=Verminephrobacter eiseniae TaxID=364317 RepID=UPI002237AC33|nr:AbrB/MazE/SpoVT family DNA-binding domain-containing protein [Verminephrobacter eiseniae]